jgi:hypothetical protein
MFTELTPPTHVALDQGVEASLSRTVPENRRTHSCANQ